MSQENLTTLQVDKDLHKELKMAAIKNNMTLLDLVNKLLKQGLLTLGMLFLFVSCASKQYVHVDEVNYKRFQHDQKVRPGMTQKEVLAKFGSPDIASENYMVGKGIVTWTYFHKIFCNHRSDRCHINFDNRGRMIYSVNVRMEFDDSLVYVD